MSKRKFVYFIMFISFIIIWILFCKLEKSEFDMSYNFL